MSEKIDRPPTMEQCAKERFALPAGWEVFKWEKFGQGTPNSGVMVTGAVCLEKFKRGPRIGKSKWASRDRATEMTLPVFDAQFDEWQAAWEVETGKCKRCRGKGQEWFGWSVTDGSKYRECSRCHRSGLSPAPKDPAP